MSANGFLESEYSLDITADVCPITFVKTKLLLETMPVGALAVIRLSRGEALDNVPRTLADYGHDVIDLEPEAGDVYVLRVRKG